MKGFSILFLFFILLTSGCSPIETLKEDHGSQISSAQMLGTVHNIREAWNPFSSITNMIFNPREDNFSLSVFLSESGGKNSDGIYAVRFNTNNTPEQVYKKTILAESGTLVTGDEAIQAGNIIFKVKKTGEYHIVFDPIQKRYAITPEIEELIAIHSIQLNGFVYDSQGSHERYENHKTFPAEKWDETLASHDMEPNQDGSWSKKLTLSTSGGHQKNGIYQCLLTANHVGDWGYGAVNGRPGKLCGGSGYNSRTGNIKDSAIVFRVDQDGEYTLTMHPTEFWFKIFPEVFILNNIDSFQVNGYVVDDPWNPLAPGHQMIQKDGGLWQLTTLLSTKGGSGKNGIYSMNFSMNREWALDSLGSGGEWGKIWHALPQDRNILFRIVTDGPHEITLNPGTQSFSIKPEVRPITGIESLQIVGDFDEFSADGQKGWNPVHPVHQMETSDGIVFFRRLYLDQGKPVHYKYTANDGGWSLSLSDYPYDGYRRLAPHGDPPPLVFTPRSTGYYRFSANIRTGEYSVAESD